MTTHAVPPPVPAAHHAEWRASHRAEGRVPPQAEWPVPHQAEWRAYWAVCALLTVIVLLPLWLYQYPGMPDYLNHLARAQVIVDAELYHKANRYFEVRHVLVANMALDTLVPLFVIAGLTTNDALRVFSVLALLLPIAGTIGIATVLQRRPPWLALLAFVLGYTRYYVFGFVNYFFALGLAMVGFAAYLHYRTQRRPGFDLRVALTTLVFGALTLVSHLMGFGIFVLLVAGAELGFLVQDARTSSVALALRSAWRGWLPAIAAIVACLAFYQASFEHGLGSELVWHETVTTKVRGLVSPFLSYDVLPGLVTAAVILALAAALVWRGVARFAAGWWIPVVVFAACFVVLPSDTMGSFFLAARLIVMSWLLAFAYFALSPAAGVRTKAVIVAVTVLLAGAKSIEVALHWRATSAITAAIRSAVDVAVPYGAKVQTVVYVEPSNVTRLIPLHHVAAFAVADRDGYMPNIFAFPLNGEAVGVRAGLVPMTKLEKHAQVYLASANVPWARFCKNFDAVIVVHMTREPTAAPACGQEAYAGAGFEIYRMPAH